MGCQTEAQAFVRKHLFRCAQDLITYQSGKPILPHCALRELQQYCDYAEGNAFEEAVALIHREAIRLVTS